MRAFGVLLLLLGGLATLFVAGLWWLRATADAGRPLPVAYVLTLLAPLVAATGIFLLRKDRRMQRTGKPPRADVS